MVYCFSPLSICSLSPYLASYMWFFRSTSKERSKEIMDESTNDGTVDIYGEPAMKGRTGRWRSGMLLLVIVGLAAIAFTGVEVNMILFLKSALGMSNAEAATMFSAWIGTFYLSTLFGAFLSDSYLGRYLTCLVFQIVLVSGMVLLSLSTQAFKLESNGCGKIGEQCNPQSRGATVLFYIAIYLVAIGFAAMEPALATFGPQQFDQEDQQESKSKAGFYSYYVAAVNLGNLIGEIAIVYVETSGKWALAFWICTLSSLASLMLLLSGTWRYRHVIKPSGNPFSRFLKVLVASMRKIKLNGGELYEARNNDENGSTRRNLLHTHDFKFLDRAAILTPEDAILLRSEGQTPNPWHLCTVTQVEEVKCVFRLVPIWLCTILPSVVVVNFPYVFVDQGAAMNTMISSTFHMPPGSMTAFEMSSTIMCIIIYKKAIVPLYMKMRGHKPNPPTKLQRIGIGIVISIIVMIVAGVVEQNRLRHKDIIKETSSLCILWQIPQYVLAGVSEAFLYAAQWEFFESQLPDGLKSFGLALSMSSSALGSYLASPILSLVMKITSKHGKSGWVPPNLNDGHLDRYFFLWAALIALDLVIFIVCARRYKCLKLETLNPERETEALP